MICSGAAELNGEGIAVLLVVDRMFDDCNRAISGRDQRPRLDHRIAIVAEELGHVYGVD